MSTPYVSKIQEVGAGAEVQIYADSISGSTWTNEAKAAHDLTITGATVVSSGGPATNLTKYVEFDGNDDRADTPHHADLVFSGTGSHGVWVWVPTNWGDSDLYSPIFSKGVSDYEFRPRQDLADDFHWAPQSGEGVGSGVAPPYGEWLFYVIVEDNTAATIYRVRSGDTSATVDASGTSDGYTSSTNPFALGARGSGGRNFNGRITGYFAIPGVLLTQQQAFDVYTAAFEETAQLATPSNFSFSAASSSLQLDGSWNPVAEAGTYDWQVERDDLGSWVAFQSGNTASTSFALDDTDGVDWSTTYRARARAVPPVA